MDDNEEKVKSWKKREEETFCSKDVDDLKTDGQDIHHVWYGEKDDECLSGISYKMELLGGETDLWQYAE